MLFALSHLPFVVDAMQQEALALFARLATSGIQQLTSVMLSLVLTLIASAAQVLLLHAFFVSQGIALLVVTV